MFAVEIVIKMGYSNKEVENIEIAGLLYNDESIRFVYITLAKQGRLTFDATNFRCDKFQQRQT